MGQSDPTSNRPARWLTSLRGAVIFHSRMSISRGDVHAKTVLTVGYLPHGRLM
jgi:hypothetical protein